MAELGSGEPAPKRVKREDIPVLPLEKKELLKDALDGLENDILFSFNLLKITKSNAEMCVSFNDSFLKVERSAEQSHPVEGTKVFNFAGVFVKGINILKLYLEDPEAETVPEDKESKLALQRLIQTILKIEDIGQSLDKVIRSGKKGETSWTICLVHHLLKELSLNKQYSVDTNSKSKSTTCICCNEPIDNYGHYDDCSLGNRAVWHGSVDILLGPQPCIAVYAHDSEDSGIHGSLSSFEVKDSQDLITDRSQILAETIVFAFLQKKNNPAFDNYLIPTVAISKKDVLFHFYDPEHDILLESPPFNIQYNSQLYYPTILALWFTLNYKTFCTGITRGMKENNFTADFLSSVSNEVKTIYQKDLHFRDCGVGFYRSTYYMPKPHAGLVLDKSEPYKSSAQK